MTEARKFEPTITLSSALTSPQLFGKIFAATSFWTWRVVAKLIDGLPLTEPREIALFEQCTGRPYNRQAPRAVRRLIILAGRRAGKDRFLSAVGVWRAICTDWRQHQSPGEGAVVILLGRDKKQAAILRKYCHGLLQVPDLQKQVVRETNEVIEFKNVASLEIASNDVALVRGRSAIAVLGSECCHWKTDDSSRSSDEEVISAAEASMAMAPDGGLLLLGSSIAFKRGYMYRQFKELHGNADSDDICWFAPSKLMNPQLPQPFIDKAMANNPHKAAAEFNCVWREDSNEIFSFDAVTARVDKGVHERPPTNNTWYLAWADMASGGGTSSAALAIVHRTPGDELVTLDLLREQRPPFNAFALIALWAALLKLYNIMEIWGDNYAFKLFADEWRKHGIICRKADTSTRENYLAALPLLLGGRVRLLDDATLCGQLMSLERHVVDGREEVAPGSNAHDDVASAAMGALVTCSRNKYDRLLRAFQPDYVDTVQPAAPVEPRPTVVFANDRWWMSSKYQTQQSKVPSADDNLKNYYNMIDNYFRWRF
jgi:hypothetical protein